MMMNPDGTEQGAWALQDLASKQIHLFTVCESEELANALLDARHLHQSHLPACRVVPVNLRMTLVTR